MASTVGPRFAAARAAWLLEARARLVCDDRVVAALVAGSVGRGTADDWSDIDLIVVLARDAELDVLSRRDEFVREFGAAVFVYDSPWNAPYDGAQVNALYEVDGDWPLYVDWDLWPAGRGAIPADVQVLVDRAGLPTTPRLLDEYRTWPRPPRPAPTTEQLRRARLAMLAIIAKCLVRNDADRAHRMLANLGYESGRTATELLQALSSLWTDARSSAREPLARVLDRVLAITADAVASRP